MILVVNLVSHNEQLMRRALASGRAAQHSRDIGEMSADVRRARDDDNSRGNRQNVLRKHSFSQRFRKLPGASALRVKRACRTAPLK
jgi:hypothetical protein